MKPLITREELAFLNQRGANDSDFPLMQNVLKEPNQPSKPFRSRLIQPSKFEKVASNLDALDLELSQTHKLYDLVDGRADGGSNRLGGEERGREDLGGGLMESLDLNTGYHGIMDKRQNQMAEHLAKKY